MNSIARCFSLLACLPLAGQGSPEQRVDSGSFGLGHGTQGWMVTTMRTGPTLGFFAGFSVQPDMSDHAVEEPGNGSERWVQHKSSTGEGHLGMAFRLDTRWVLGLGVGYSHTSYRYTYNPGSNPFLIGPLPPGPGPLEDHTFGLVAMADVRLGSNWGLEVVGGSIGFGGALTFRF